MTDKIKLKADKFVNDKKLKLNYIKPKDLKILLAEFCEEQIGELKAECDLAIEGRDIKIKELEKENAELRNNGFTVSAMTEQQLKVALKKGEQLEKENAELKDYRLTTLAKQQTDMSKYALNLEHKLSWYDDQLTKAKEIIKKLIEAIHIWDCKNLEKVEAEAEQFLSEVEK